MDKRFLTLMAILALTSTASSVDINLIQDNRVRHLGDEYLPAWAERPDSEGLNFSVSFEVEAIPNNATMDMELYNVDVYDPIIINGQVITNLPYSGGWGHPTVSIPPEALHKGRNTLIISSTLVDGNNWDDVMIKNINFTVHYDNLDPYIVKTKTMPQYDIMLGELANVTVTLVNIGIRAANNVTLEDYLPENAYMVHGNLTKKIWRMQSGEVYTLQYVILPADTGILRSRPGRVTYYDNNRTEHNATIEPTELYVHPYMPKTIFVKNASADTVATGSDLAVTVTFTNNGTYDLYNLTLTDYLPDNMTLTSGYPNATFAVLEAGENATINYTVSPTFPGVNSLAAEASFNDRTGLKYNHTSNYVKITATQKTTTPVNYNQAMIIAGLAVIIAVLFIVYLRIRGH